MPMYKYRSLQTFEHFVDILLYRRLYAAPFLTLNDPMEGRYVSRLGAKNKTAIRRLRSDNNLRIVSLSSVWNSTLMWSHYADRHRGVVISVEIDEPDTEVLPMRYVSGLRGPQTSDSTDRARALLLQKHEFWQYENEYRVIVEDKEFIHVKITEITIGLAVDKRIQDIIIDLADTIDSSIQVTQILKKGLDVVWEPRQF